MCSGECGAVRGMEVEVEEEMGGGLREVEEGVRDGEGDWGEWVKEEGE